MTKHMKITLSGSRDIPFNQLVLSQANVRRVKAGVSIDALAADIARRGLLQSLTVRVQRDEDGNETGLFEVPAGGRRFRALQQLVKQRKMAKTEPVPCIVREDDAISAEEDSLAENTHREALHPLDQFRTMQQLVTQGTDIETIAATFMVTPAVVRQRLRLASVSPKLHEIYAKDSRFQLVASKRYDGTKPLGFTLLRRHPPELAEAANRKNTWYEYLIFDGEVAVAEIEELDIGLEGRKFRTGSLLKLFSYRLPEGARSIISRDLNLSLNEFLFEPALPFLTVDSNERYPENRAPITPVYGLKRRLEADNDTVETRFSEVSRTAEFGELAVTVYVFKARSRGQGVKETKQYIQREYFKNGMTVLFSLNGQVHGSYTSEFVTRALKMPLLKDYLLVHVDCSNLHLAVRNELFMASRDRLKAGDKADAIRKHLRELLVASELKDISRRRKASLNLDGADAGQMLRELTRNMPMNEALTRILRQTFDIPDPKPGATPKKEREEGPRPRKEPRDAPPFHPKRYPTAFNAKGGDGQERGLKLFKLPQGGSRTIAYATDVENDFFDRTDDPGDLSLATMRPSNAGSGGGGAPDPSKEGDLLDIIRTSPSNGTIKVGIRATAEMKVGDCAEIRATLTSPQGDLIETVLVRITDPERAPPRKMPDVEPPLGIPELILCSREGGPGLKSWEEINEAGIDMSYDEVVFPFVDEDKLARIYVNVDSRVLKDFNSGSKSPEAVELAERRYISAVYFHTLFLFATTKSRRYDLRRGDGSSEVDVDLAEYVSDLFRSSYAQFLLNFDTADLLEAVS